MRKQSATPVEAIITDDLAGQRLDKALAVALPTLSRVRLQALMAEGFVSRDGKAVMKPTQKVKAGETYIVSVPPPEPAEPLAQKMHLNIVYEDKDLLVIDKPIGMVVHPAPGNRDKTLVNALLAHCGKSLSGIGGVVRPGIVHRLDKDTSGLMVVAKNDAAHQALSKQFADRTLSRTYRALVWGIPSPERGIIEGSIGRNPRDRKKMAVTKMGKAALTHYRVLETFGIQDSGLRIQVFKTKNSNANLRNLNPESRSLSLIECKLATGRTHQIRVHFAHHKHPVVGDPVYGKKGLGNGVQGSGKKIFEAVSGFPRQALHAWELKFKHPRSGKIMRFKSEMPADMMKLLNKLRSL